LALSSSDAAAGRSKIANSLISKAFWLSAQPAGNQ
jgi:hypothetical protein